MPGSIPVSKPKVPNPRKPLSLRYKQDSRSPEWMTPNPRGSPGQKLPPWNKQKFCSYIGNLGRTDLESKIAPKVQCLEVLLLFVCWLLVWQRNVGWQRGPVAQTHGPVSGVAWPP